MSIANAVRASRALAVAMLLCAIGGDALAAGARTALDAPAVEARPGPPPAPPQIVRELRASLERARLRFEARDAAGVLAQVSEQYRTGPFTKAEIRRQLLAIYEIYTAVRARVVIDAVELVDGGAWVYTTGEVTGRLPLVGTWMTVLSWERELEVVRREGGSWRLFGYQQ